MAALFHMSEIPRVKFASRRLVPVKGSESDLACGSDRDHVSTFWCNDYGGIRS